MYTTIFSPLRLGDLVFKNRLIMAPTYLGYAGPGGTVSPLLLEHYRLMAASGVAMVVVENATIDHPTASGSERTLRADTDAQLDGLQLDESRLVARSLAASGVAYLSVMGGTFESFFLPHIKEKSKHDGYMVDLAAAIRKEVTVPVVAAGRIATGELAEQIISTGSADLIGLARVLWADPDWLHKVSAGRESEILHCDPDCGDACIQMVMKKKPAFCTRWAPQKAKEYKARFN